MSTKIVARTITQDRMLKSAEYFMAAFFGLDWTRNASLVPTIEQLYYNITLDGYENCNNSNNFLSTGGNNSSLEWENIYLDISHGTNTMSIMTAFGLRKLRFLDHMRRTICGEVVNHAAEARDRRGSSRVVGPIAVQHMDNRNVRSWRKGILVGAEAH
ncbi:uncharacterized protein A1O5_07536 [Cladophialophora psammophila CBS 110553]|uniref:Uncharacterized protein n=1 Tax=Cladophialophora psammophila CBS 110553 TaxID=1182543 RepID=W9WWS2_9EURO|nr:uncharacterized protein A1O5_07536 [Cladophialophora psammophila CBS 110553]EXJ69500.1 hypothetical protein A1O5_07536 [Cladophialophora psammophila CBS 110553]